jgi:hypothetical protein
MEGNRYDDGTKRSFKWPKARRKPFAWSIKPPKKYFIGNAQLLKRMEMTESSLRENAMIVITENGISPTYLLGSLPVTLTTEEKRVSGITKFKN